MNITPKTNGKKRRTPKWSDVKGALGAFDRPELLKLVADLYRLSGENRDFLHTRFSLGEDPLEPYKTTIEDAVYPDVMCNRPLRIADAKRAISQYRKARGDPRGVLELMLCFVEQGTLFTVNFGDIDEPFYLAMLRMYDKAIAQLFKLDRAAIRAYAPRFRDIVESSSGIGWGYHDDLASMYHENLGEYDEDPEDCTQT